MSKKEETRLHILDTAINMFWHASYHGVNMNDLSKAANLNKATVYQYFSSKEELAAAAVERAADCTKGHVFETAFNEYDTPLERLKGVYANVFKTHEEIFKVEKRCLGCPFVNIGVELATSSDAVTKSVNASFAIFKEYYLQIIRDFKQSMNEKPDTDAVDEVAEALIANMNSCLVASKLKNDPKAILDGSERALKILKTW